MTLKKKSYSAAYSKLETDPLNWQRYNSGKTSESPSPATPGELSGSGWCDSQIEKSAKIKGILKHPEVVQDEKPKFMSVPSTDNMDRMDSER